MRPNYICITDWLLSLNFNKIPWLFFNSSDFPHIPRVFARFEKKRTDFHNSWEPCIQRIILDMTTPLPEDLNVHYKSQYDPFDIKIQFIKVEYCHTWTNTKHTWILCYKQYILWPITWDFFNAIDFIFSICSTQNFKYIKINMINYTSYDI